MGVSSGRQDSKKAIGERTPKNIPDQFVKTRVKIEDNYIIERELGYPSHGEVFLVRHKSTDTLRAMKRIPKKNINQRQRNTLNNEVYILKQLDHPNIVKVYESLKDANYLYIILEYLSGGKLFDSMFNKQNKNKFTESVLARIMKSILEGVAHCHSKQIIHRNLKPSNLLFEDKELDAQVKLRDFILAFQYQADNDGPYDMEGTLLYMSPEVVTETICYDTKCDLWSCGVILMQMLTSRVPYSSFNITESRLIDEMRALNQDQLDQIINQFNISQPAKQLMKQMLSIMPEKRISAQDALAHPWILQKSYLNYVTDTNIEEIPEKLEPQFKQFKLNDNYQIVRSLGAGSQGDVFLIQHKYTHIYRTMKKIPKDTLTHQNNELLILQQLDHRNIVKLYDVHEDLDNLYIVTEYLSGGEIPQRIFNKGNQNLLSEQQVARIMQSILDGLAHMHARRIIHRNLKPQNILFENSNPDAQVKLIGFGAAFKCKLIGDGPKEIVGTMLYTSPEVATQTKGYDNKSDVWSCGVILMQLLTSKVPYSSPYLDPSKILDEMRIMNQDVLDQVIEQYDNKSISERAKQLMLRMLTINPYKRISAQDALVHSWIIDNINDKQQRDNEA